MRLGVWLGGQVSFGRAAQILRELGQIPISTSTLWRCTRQWGGELVALQAQEVAAANAMPSRDQPQSGESKHTQRMGVSLDGWMVNIRGEGWKEVKTGVIYRIVPCEEKESQTGELVERAAAVDLSYVAHLGGPEPFGELLWQEAVRRQVPAAYEKVCVSDAAAWIWGLCQDYFPEAGQLVDWYHALTHLHEAATLAFSEDAAKANRWIHAHQTLLYQGQPASVANHIDTLASRAPAERSQALQSQATFFRHHSHRMAYLEFREQGWPIGSGPAEAACKQFQSRLKGPGMRWSRPGADRMLVLCSTILSDRFDERWRALQNSPVF